MPKALKDIEDATPFVTVKHLSAKQLNNISIPFLPIDEQKKVANLFNTIFALIEKHHQQLDILDELVKSRFVEMFGDADLAQTRPEWRFVSEIGTVVGGATPKTTNDEFWDGIYRWITPAELENESGYIFDSVRKITEAGVKSCALTELPVGTVILSSRAPIGKVAIAGNTFYCNQGFKNIICNQDINPVFLYSLLRMNTGYLNSLGRGATFKEISKAIVENIRIPVSSENAARPLRRLRRTDRQIKIGSEAEPRKTGNAEKIADAAVLWVKEDTPWVKREQRSTLKSL